MNETMPVMSAAPESEHETAAEVRRLHAEVVGDLRRTVAKAMEIGRLLAEAKARLPHGGFQDWIREECGFSPETGRRYMRMHEARALIETSEADTVTEALRLLAPTEKTVTMTGFPPPPPEQIGRPDSFEPPDGFALLGWHDDGETARAASIFRAVGGGFHVGILRGRTGEDADLFDGTLRPVGADWIEMQLASLAGEKERAIDEGWPDWRWRLDPWPGEFDAHPFEPEEGKALRLHRARPTKFPPPDDCDCLYCRSHPKEVRP